MLKLIENIAQGIIAIILILVIAPMAMLVAVFFELLLRARDAISGK